MFDLVTQNSDGFPIQNSGRTRQFGTLAVYSIKQNGRLYVPQTKSSLYLLKYSSRIPLIAPAAAVFFISPRPLADFLLIRI